MKKLVVIDDEYLTIEGIRVMLKRIGVDYEMAGFASDGQMALELIENVHPDVVFIDIRMPGLSGLEVIEHFYKKYPDMIFVLVSAYKEFEYARRGMELGVHSYIDKPVTMDKLKATLEKIDEEFEKRPSKTDVENEKLIRDLRLSLNAVVEMINDSNTENWEGETRRIQQLLKKAKYGLPEYKEESYKLITAASAAFYEKWKQYEHDFNFPLFNNIEEMKTKEEVDEYVYLILQRIFEKISVRKIGSSHRVITQILDYINQNYSQDFGLNEMAEMVHMNHAYLSILFKDEVGISFVRYLTQIRMAHAKELLLKGAKVQEVSEVVGYNNYRYFCNIFKKEEGVTPMQFKSGVRKSKEN
ncbi:response regulator transcription factor [Blautia luti]|uniref:Stage 0 sporulation protein A homolog n=1 Tax=Blautia luti TaxID=89014 RepID=A0A564W4J9_9FIRM|nr:response regulator [Blautia luti]MBE5704535.1 response regulator [Ruminococcus sp.]VUX39307.1 HTH-type transcriptional regulator YesS [Blautia luti]